MSKCRWRKLSLTSLILSSYNVTGIVLTDKFLEVHSVLTLEHLAQHSGCELAGTASRVSDYQIISIGFLFSLTI